MSNDNTPKHKPARSNDPSDQGKKNVQKTQK
ncbi:hypothetical protein BCM02_109222 [Paenibacillus methanolicus]|uniref:Uncharacterized protein n=1 Tax=Paenibacillus methanolicus TaxID=582686 RepID=A0A5S5C1V7_9BACL|nr:hypothetical protein BCM02_109222 [Paenibacillus methanolicus]